MVFLAPSNIPEIHTPDILMDGIEWEMKAPQGSSKRTIEKNLLINKTDAAEDDTEELLYNPLDE